MKRTKKLIKFRQTLFWDVNPKKIDPKKNAQYIVERIMDFGTTEEVKWMVYFYDRRTLKKVVANPRRLMPISRNFWHLILGVKKSKSVSLQKYEHDIEKMKKPF